MQFITRPDNLQEPRTNIQIIQSSSSVEIHAAYLHIPFCFHKCHYCDFYSIVDQRDRQEAFTQRIIDELHVHADQYQGPIQSLFIGGGTPTLLKTELWATLLLAIHDTMQLSDNAEFTVESNPETVTEDLMHVLAAGGVNRISIGAQSFHTKHLKTLERWHDPDNVAKAVDHARSAGIDNINLDLIFAIPGQTLDEWHDDLDTALAQNPTHLSCYSLMFEQNTALTRKMELGLIHRCDENLEAEMYETTIKKLVDADFEHYEISNFALRHATPTESPSDTHSHRCGHNMAYWMNHNWLAIGPSASGHVNGQRWKNAPHLGQYLDSKGGCPITEFEKLEPYDSVGEQLMLRLRLIEGVEIDWLTQHLDISRQELIHRQVDENLLETTETHLRLTQKGLMIADSVISELL